MKPLNLKELFGKRFKIKLDEAAKSTVNGLKDPWLYTIPCKFGHIYPISNKCLGFWCTGVIINRRIQKDHPEIELVQDGDGEGVFRFTFDQFDTIAGYAKPKKKRRLSKEHKNKLLKASKAYQFQLKKHGCKDA